MDPSPAPTHDVAADAADAPLVPMLRWHHLAAIACLTRGTSVPHGARANATTNLLMRLSAASDIAFLDACRPDQATDTPAGVLSHAGALGMAAGKPAYDALWGIGGSSFPIALRRTLPGGEAHLSADALLVPWPLGAPFAADEGLKLDDRYGDLYLAAGRCAIPEASQNETDAGVALQLAPFMHAVDDAVDPKSPHRDDFATVMHDNDDALGWIENRAQTSLPATLTVQVHPTWPTSATRWKVVGGALHLALGWLDPDTAAAPVIHQWPCGAFRGFEYGSP